MSNRNAKWRTTLLIHDPHCWYCGRPLTQRTATLDHYTPIARGGDNSPTNLRLSCRPCNEIKADHLMQQLVCPLPRGVGLFTLSELRKGRLMATIKGFNYSALKTEQQKTARDAAKRIHNLLEKTAHAAVEIGRQLQATKDALGTRAFRQWLEAEFEWGTPFAYKHMLAARTFGELDCLGNFQPTALFVLARKNVPQAAVEEAIAKARAGELVTHKTAAQIVQQHGVVPTRKDAGVPRTNGQSVTVDALTAVQQSLDAFSASIAEWAAKMPRDDREALADRFLQMALQLRTAETKPARKPAAKAKPRKRTSRSTSKAA